jgi:hypothetical protein
LVLPSGDGPVAVFASEALMPAAASSAGLGFELELSPDDDALEVALDAAAVADALAMIELASSELIVEVLSEVEAESVLEPELELDVSVELELELEPDELDDEDDDDDELEELEEPLEERMSEGSVCEMVSMNAMTGPATRWVVSRSIGLAATGWSSDMIQIATGPLIPEGTTHWLKGSEIAKGRPPMSMLQNMPSVEPFRADELKVSAVPVVTEPVLVIARAGLAAHKSVSQHWNAESNRMRGIRLTRDAEVAAGDEPAGDSEHLGRGEAKVECLWDRRAGAGEDVEHGLVARLDGEDRAGGGEQDRVVEQVRRAKVGGDTQVLDDTRGRSHDADGAEHGREVELAARDGGAADAREGALSTPGVSDRTSVECERDGPGARWSGSPHRSGSR